MYMATLQCLPSSSSPSTSPARRPEERRSATIIGLINQRIFRRTDYICTIIGKDYSSADHSTALCTATANHSIYPYQRIVEIVTIPYLSMRACSILCRPCPLNAYLMVIGLKRQRLAGAEESNVSLDGGKS